MEKELDSFYRNCKNCGGNLEFDPNEQCLKCFNCGSKYQIEKNTNVKKHELNKKQDDKSKEYLDYVEQNKIFKCSNCGSNVVLNVYEISKKCPYCGTNLVSENSSIPGLLPDGVLPFEFNKEKAGQIFVEKVKKKWLAPKKFKKAPPTSEISAFYIPAFSFDGDTHSNYVGRMFNEYTETDAEGKQHTRREYFDVSGNLDKRFENVLIECSQKVNQTNLAELLPYNFGKKVAYQNAFIMGYSAEHYAEGLDECKNDYRSITKNAIRSAILNMHPHDGVDFLNVNTDYKNEFYSYYLVPMYKFEYSYKEKKYVTYMNGQTGKIDSKLPKSAGKITLIVLLILLFVVGPIILGIILGAN